MTNCKKAFLALALVFMMCGGAYAQTACFGAQGSATVPGLFTIYASSTYEAASHIFVSNVSSSNVTCKITAFDQDGNDITAAYSNILSASAVLTTGTGTFELPAGSTRLYRFKSTAVNVPMLGYAIVEWKSDDPKLRKALVAMHYRQQTVGSSVQVSDTNVNGGQPF